MPLPAGEAKLAYEFIPDGSALKGSGVIPQVSGTGKLYINGELAGEGKISHFQAVFPYGFAYFGGFGIGRAYDSPINSHYQLPFSFTGTIEKVTVEVK